MALFFAVESEAQADKHHMTILFGPQDEQEAPYCSCADYFHRRNPNNPQYQCKHIHAARWLFSPQALPVDLAGSVDPQHPVKIHRGIWGHTGFRVWRQDELRAQARKAGQPEPPPLDPTGTPIEPLDEKVLAL